MKRCVVALISNHEDNLLMGKRTDSNLWAFPAGTLEDGEDPKSGMIRELKEETGLDVLSIKLVDSFKDDSIEVFLFKIKVDPTQEIDPSKDPDKEFDHLTYECPIEKAAEMHVPLKRNLAFKYWAGL